MGLVVAFLAVGIAVAVAARHGGFATAALAQDSISVPSTEECSSDNSALTRF